MVEIAAGLFKAKCLKIMDDVKNYQEKVIITKRGKPIAQLVPIEETKPRPLFGFLKGSLEIKDNIMDPIDENWEALSE